jgi:hypothetical protein
MLSGRTAVSRVIYWYGKSHIAYLEAFSAVNQQSARDLNAFVLTQLLSLILQKHTSCPIQNGIVNP